MKILFVCTGNTCRSPMCEAYWNHLCKNSSPDAGIVALSAGICAGSIPQGASPHAKEVLAVACPEILNHRSRQLTREMLRDADLIVPMTQSHRMHIGKIAPEALAKTRLLKEFDPAAGEEDVRDPFGGDRDVYSACFEEMKRALDALRESLTGNNSLKTNTLKQ